MVQKFPVTLLIVLSVIYVSSADSSGTCFLSSYQLPPPDINPGHPSQFFGQNDAQQKITDQQPPQTKGGPSRPPTTKGGPSPSRPPPSGTGLRGFETPATTSTTPFPFPPPRRINYSRPASRGARPILSPPFQTQEPQYINAEELETIALFEAALERAKQDFGSRINGVDSRSQFSSLGHDQSAIGRSPLPKSPPRKRPQQQFNPPINPGTNFFHIDFNDFSQERITTVDQDYDFSRSKTSQRRITDEQTRIELPPSQPPTTRPPATTTSKPYRASSKL